MVVLDLLMPGLPGDEALHRLKAAQPDLPVILLTGHEVVDDTGLSPVCQAYACLTKPLSFNVFLETLEAAVRECRETASREGGRA